MKLKSFWVFYVVTAIILAGVAAVPLWNLLAMVLAYHKIAQFGYNATAVIPFAAVLAAIFIGFLFLPLLWHMSMRKKRIIVSVGAVGIFFGLGLYSEMIAARLDTVRMVLTSRMMYTPATIDLLASQAAIPWEVRVHYYIFSVIFILAVLNFLYILANVLYGDGRHSKRVVILHGAATGCYGLAYFLVRVMQYENHATLHLAWGSVLNAAICFVLAAIAVGLYCSSFIPYKGWERVIPPALSVVTVLALYLAQHFMLGGNFYLYSGYAAMNIFLRILIVVVPGVIVHFLLRKYEKIKIA
ncbi:MAG: hypothetical protein FWE42_09330 [Defluviitaleaceae bacterium]|nr:hypothetical protein [Defluviitaleaceae bacterium]